MEHMVANMKAAVTDKGAVTVVVMVADRDKLKVVVKDKEEVGVGRVMVAAVTVVENIEPPAAVVESTELLEVEEVRFLECKQGLLAEEMVQAMLVVNKTVEFDQKDYHDKDT